MAGNVSAVLLPSTSVMRPTRANPDRRCGREGREGTGICTRAGGAAAFIREFEWLSVIATTFSALVILASFVVPVQAADSLAKESQNPLSTVVSVPFESNTLFNVGPSEATVNVVNVKPVYPLRIGDWNLVNRLIAPVIWTEGQDRDAFGSVDAGFGSAASLLSGSEFGLGDVTYQGFITPAKAGTVIWGVGPAVVMPTHTADRFGSDKWSIGPAAVALTMPGNWVLGGLVQNVWSFAGPSGAPDVNKFVGQYFINYNLEGGWYLSSSPVITANWEADSDDRWTVPIGGGVGRLVKFGKQPVDFKAAAYVNVVKPDLAPDWSLQLQVKWLFPK